MPGSPPKPPEQRRRRNVSSTKRELPVASGRKAPPVPIRGHLAKTRKWWQVVWASPMAAEWLDADVLALERLCMLVERMYRGDLPVAAMGPMLRLEESLGLTPLARRRLEWKTPATDAPDVAAPVEDGDRWLRAVK